MNKTILKLSAKSALALATAASLAGFMLVAPVALAQGSPVGCTNNNLSMSLNKDVVATANGMVVNFQVEVSNIGAHACDITGATISFTAPATNGTPTGTTTVLGSALSFPANGTVQCWTTASFACPGGDNSMINSALAWTTNVNAGVFDATAKADQTGSNGTTTDCPSGGALLHDTDTGHTVCQSKTIGVEIADAKISITPNGTNEVGKTHTFTGHVDVSAGAPFVNAPNGTIIHFSKASGPGTFSPVSGDCTTAGGTGSCTIDLSSSTTGVTVVNASTTVAVDGVTLNRTTDSTHGSSGPATKTWVDLQIFITASSTNEIGVDHTFTVTVNQDLGNGSGFVPLSGATVVPGITGTGSLTGTGTCQTGTTNGFGNCTIIVHSATPGVGTVSASVTASVGGSASIIRALDDGKSGDGTKPTKTWVDANIQITPAQATDPVNDNHVLTGHVNINTGTGGYVNAPDGTSILFTIVSGPGSFTTTNPCLTTGGTGSCTVTLTSPTVGTTIVKAGTSVTVGGVTLARETGDSKTGDGANASKTWTQTALTTTASGTVILGNAIHDVAHLTGTSNATTGHITFNVYGPSVSPICVTPLNGSPIAATPDPVTGDGNFTSADFTPTSAGTYYWKAHYSGDGSNNAADTACGADAESVVVTPKTPSITTKLSASTVNINTNVHDSATLVGASSNAGGTVTYHAYAGANTCSGTDLLNNTKTVTNGSVPDSDNISFPGSGTYSFQATYSGDGNNTGPVSSDCTTEQLVVNSFTATMTTAIHQGATDSGAPVFVTSVPAGTTVHDSAALTFSGPTPTGNVDFTFFDTAGNCDSHSVAAGSVAINGSGVADPSNAEGPLAAGSYAFKAHWVGDGNYPNGATSDCEILTVNKINSVTTTAIKNGQATVTAVAPGTTVNDTVLVAPATTGPTPTGIVDFTFFNNIGCTPTGAGAGSPSLVSGAASSNSEGPLSTGSYSFKAHYEGDGTYNPSDSGCEPLTVSQNTPTISTQLSTSSPVNVGAVVNDTATLSGATSNAGGTVTYSVYTDNACTVLYASQPGGPVTVTSGSVPPSGSVTFTAAGTFYWQASYSGDTNNAAAKSSCQSEVLVVNQPVILACSPGYWKNHPDSKWPSPYTHATLFGSIFSPNTVLSSRSLGTVLSTGGGGLIAFGRQIVNALLSAKTFGSSYPLTVSQVQTLFTNTVASGNFDAAMAQLEGYGDNCPLN